MERGRWGARGHSTGALSSPRSSAPEVGSTPSSGILHSRGGQKLTGIFGDEYREYLVKHLGRGQRGSADLVAYFFLRMASLLKTSGHFGLIATNTIAQGDTREVGLDQLVSESHPDRVVLTRAVPSRPWPGGASLEVAHVYGRSIRGQSPDEAWRGPFHIDDAPAVGITSFLTPPGRVVGKPHRLKANEGKSFQGSITLGTGFMLTPTEAKQIIATDSRYSAVIRPYIRAEDVLETTSDDPQTFVICFWDWPLDRHSAPSGYNGPVASDFPICLDRVSQLVKPQRDQLREDGGTQSRRKRLWWRYGGSSVELYKAAASLPRMLFHGFTTKYLVFTFQKSTAIFAAPHFAFAIDDDATFGLLQSTVHELWVREHGSTLETRMRYPASDVFETFPFPNSSTALRQLGESLYSRRRDAARTLALGLTDLLNEYHARATASAGYHGDPDWGWTLQRSTSTAWV